MAHPGCFGSAVAVSASSQTCRTCQSVRGCLVGARDVLAQLPDTPALRTHRQALRVTAIALLGAPGAGQGAQAGRTVSESSRGVRRLSLTERESRLVAQLPQRVGRQFKTLLERGWFAFAHEELKAGRNPATKGWRKVLCAALLQGGCTRQSLQLAFVEQLGLTPASAKAQVSFGVSILTAGQVVQVCGSIIMISQN